MATDILTTIMQHKRLEVAAQQARIPARRLEQAIAQQPATRSMSRSLRTARTGIIAEFKRRSPSRGWICREAKVADIVPKYAQGGAAALSVLTDKKFFGGSLDDLRQARSLCQLPILRKDFICTEYQLLEARAAGADAVLLIAAVLTPAVCCRLTAQAHDLGLEVLLELHDASEVACLEAGPDMVGVNNRHLGTFHTDVSHALTLAGKLPQESLKVAESGITTAAELQHLKQAGFDGFLIGSALMDAPQPQLQLQKLLSQP